MDNKKKIMIIATVEAAVAVVMLLVVKVIAPVCPGMLELATGKQVHMKCYYAGVVFVFIAVALLINAVLSMVVKPSITSGIMTVVLAALVYATLNESIGIGICAKAEMECQMTAPYVKVCAGIEIICGLVQALIAKKEG